MKRCRMGEGVTAERMREMLRELGYEVDFFVFPDGWWRSPRADVMRWEAHCFGPRGAVNVGSWDTMTKCVRYGFTIEDDHKKNLSDGVEVHANSQQGANPR